MSQPVSADRLPVAAKSRPAAGNVRFGDTLGPPEPVVIASRYRLDRRIGEGGMGTVYAATDLRTDEKVALKLVKRITGDPLDRYRRFLREARAARAVRHPNVVRVHELTVDDTGAPVMVMELLQGESLAERLRRKRMLDLAEAARIFVPVVSAVGCAHAVGVVHRDLKPDNIFLVGTEGKPLDVRVLDFGIAKLTAKEGVAAGTEGITATGDLLGSPHYMSPEQIFGERDLDHRTDVWALGIILYECLSGHRPVEGENVGQIIKATTSGTIVPLEQVAPHLPADVTALVGRMLERDRNRRPSDLREVYDTLRPHSDVRAITFEGPASDITLDSAAEQAVLDEARRLVVTVDETANPLERTGFSSTASRPPPRRTLLVFSAAAVAVMAAAVYGGLFRGADPGHGAPASNGTATTTAASTPVVPAPISATAPAPVAPIVSATPSVTAHHPKPPPAVSHSVASAAPSITAAPPPSAAPSSKKLPGGVVGEAPF